jgi:protein TonB
VPSNLFDTIVEVRPAVRGGRFSAIPVSIFVHVLVLIGLVVIPLLASDVLPLVQAGSIDSIPILATPVPPSVPAPAVRRVVPDVVNQDMVPLFAPEGIGRERMIQAAPPTDITGLQLGVVDGGIDGGTAFNTVVEPPPPPPPTTPIRITRGLKPPVKIRDAVPIYPETARIARVDGMVIIEAVISATGDVVEARVLRSRPLLDEAALAAVRQWKYTPTLLGGTPVPVVMTVTVNFTLR